MVEHMRIGKAAVSIVLGLVVAAALVFILPAHGGTRLLELGAETELLAQQASPPRPTPTARFPLHSTRCTNFWAPRLNPRTCSTPGIC